MNDAVKADRSVLERWIKEYIAGLIGEPFESIASDMQFLEFDMDSIDAVTMALEMEKALNMDVPPEIFLDGLTTIEEVLDYFKTQIR